MPINLRLWIYRPNYEFSYSTYGLMRWKSCRFLKTQKNSRLALTSRIGFCFESHYSHSLYLNKAPKHGPRSSDPSRTGRCCSEFFLLESTSNQTHCEAPKKNQSHSLWMHNNSFIIKFAFLDLDQDYFKLPAFRISLHWRIQMATWLRE